MLRSISKAFSILRLFSPSQPILTLNEISEKLDIPRSTVHSIIRTLRKLGIVEKINNNRYAIGKGIIPLTNAALVNVKIRDRIAPLLRQLNDITKQTVYLTVPDGNMILFIYAIETHHRLLARSSLGNRTPYHCNAVGKAILAYASPSEQLRIIREVGLARFTENTITDEADLFEELKRTFERGYAIDNREHGASFCIGAPIFDADGIPIASCSVSGDDPAIIDEQREFYANKVTYTTQEASRRMGYVPSNNQNSKITNFL